MMDATQKEAAHRAASDAELICWVDEQDNLLGPLVRSDLRQRGLIGRCTFIFLFNSAGELCVHRRTLSKAMYPGFWDTAAGGMVRGRGELRRVGARELEEELGVGGVELIEHDHFYFEDGDSRLWCSPTPPCGMGPCVCSPKKSWRRAFYPLKRSCRRPSKSPTARTLKRACGAIWPRVAKVA